MLLALGNDLLGDDAVGFAAARALKDWVQGRLDVVESSEVGLTLLDLMEGYDRLLILDAVSTGKCAPGTVLEYTEEDFKKIVSSSPHFAGLPEVLHLGRCLSMPIPKDIRILAMEVDHPVFFRSGLSRDVENALPVFVERAKQLLS